MLRFEFKLHLPTLVQDMWTILLDIDGTLLRTKGAGLAAIKQAVEELFGEEIELPKISVHGRTDAGIMADLLEGQTFDWSNRLPEIFECYCKHLKTRIGDFEGCVYPGAVEFLTELWRRKNASEQANQGVAIGLLTGNCKQAAYVKIEHFELQSYVEEFGGFGDVHPDRNDVAASAKSSAQAFLGERFDENKVWVIGDTANDIRCARWIGAKVVAVATGGSSFDDLAAHNPDICVQDLAGDSLVDQLLDWDA